MNLISCNNCGVALNKDKLMMPSDIFNEDGSVNDKLAIWDSDSRSYVAFINCPVCKAPIWDSIHD